jgi:hypothetical protein
MGFDTNLPELTDADRAVMNASPPDFIAKCIEQAERESNGWPVLHQWRALWEKYRQTDAGDDERGRLFGALDCLWNDQPHELIPLPAECLECGKAEGPLYGINDECPGWLCNACYQIEKDRH